MKKAVLKVRNRQIVVVKSENGYAFAGVENEDFKEVDHPRDKSGKFTSKGGAGSGSKEKPAEKKQPENKENIEKAKNILRNLGPVDLEPPSKEAEERMEGTGASADMRLPMLWSFKNDAKKAVEKALNEKKDVQVEVAESIRGFVIDTGKNVDKMPPYERRDVREILKEIMEMTYKLKNRYEKED